MRFTDLIAECLPQVTEIFPWDLIELVESSETHPLLLDIREPYEFRAMRIAGSINVPRGILESACEWDYEETVPALVTARSQDIVVICRSGNRSVLAAHVMQRLGYKSIYSLKTGLRGWNDYEQQMIDDSGPVEIGFADDYFAPKITAEQQCLKSDR